MVVVFIKIRKQNHENGQITQKFPKEWNCDLLYNLKALKTFSEF
jgi:hypothetical protein